MKSFKDAVAQYTKRSSSGMLITKPGYTGGVWKPKWSSRGEQKAETHIRFTGPLTEDRKNFMPWRYGPEDNEFGHWLVCLPLFKGGTTETFSFVAAIEDPDNPGELLDIDTNPTPASEFLLHAKRMANSDPALKNILTVGAKGRAAPLPRKLEGCALAQGVLLLHGVQNYYKRPQLPVLFCMSQGASYALQTLLNKKTEGYAGDPLDLKNRFASGDILDVNDGRIFSFFNALAGTAAPEEASVNWDKAGASAGQQTSQEFEHYAVDIRSKMPVPRDDKGQIVNPGGKALFTPWVDVIRILTVKEQVDLLCRAYADLPGLLRDCLRPYGDYLPNFVTGKVVTGVSGLKASPGARQPGQAPQATQPVVAQEPPVQDTYADVDWSNAGEAAAPGENGAELKTAIDVGLVAPQAVQPAVQQSVAPATNDARINAAKARLANLQASVK